MTYTAPDPASVPQSVKDYAVPLLASEEHLTPGFWYAANGGRQTTTYGANALTIAPIRVPYQVFVDQIAVEVTTAGNLIRLGVYSDKGNAIPDALLYDSGTVSASTTGVKTATCNLSLDPGVYWLGIVAQGANVSVRALSGNLRVVGSTTASDVTGQNGGVNGYAVTGVTAALPANIASGYSVVSNAPAMAVHVMA